jgi:carbon-monoxide dehydrogenase medium subunit
MLLPKFDFHEPATVAEACQIKAEYGENAKLLAGGTDLLVDMKKKLISPKHLVSISRIAEMKQLDFSADGLIIGSGVTVGELTESKGIGQKWSALREGANTLGSPQIRNLATIGGNIGSARPAADLPPSLISYGAKLVLKSKTGQRVISMDRFFGGVGLTEIGPDEIITEIQMEAPPPYSGAGYIPLGS